MTHIGMILWWILWVTVRESTHRTSAQSISPRADSLTVCNS